MQYTRVYADTLGETHYGEVEVALSAVDFAPPALPVYLSVLHTATRWGSVISQQAGLVPGIGPHSANFSASCLERWKSK